MKKTLYSLFTATLFVALFISCSEDAAPPMVEIFYEVDADEPYTIHFTTTDKNVNTYTWEFGDNTSSSETEPIHTYAMSGDYTVTLTAKGDGGETMATKKINISASIEEMLSGGSAMANGKTWVLSKVATTGFDGVGNVNAEFLNDVLPGANDMLNVIGLPDEWDNEYTFVHNGNYSIDNGNQNVLAGWIYSSLKLGEDQIVNITPYGVFQVKNTAPTNAKWTFTDKKDLSFNAAIELEDGAEDKTVVLNPDKYLGYIEFENGGFIGVQDYITTAIVRDITSERLVLTIVIYSNQYSMDKPSILITVSFDAK